MRKLKHSLQRNKISFAISDMHTARMIAFGDDVVDFPGTINLGRQISRLAISKLLGDSAIEMPRR